MISVEARRQIAKMRDTVKAHKDRLRRLSIIEKGKDTDFWKALSGELKVSIEANEAERDMILENESEDHVRDSLRVKARASAIKSYRGIIYNVEQVSEKITSTNNKIAEINQIIDKAEAEARSEDKPSKGGIV